MNKKTEAKLEELNKKYAVVEIAGTMRIWNGKSFMKFDDFNKKLENQIAWIGEGEKAKPIPIANLWRKWEGRKEYDKAVFYPGKLSGNILNLWEGWAYKPGPGDWCSFQDHICENICMGNDEYAHWIFAWLKQLFQHPETKPGTALVLRGEKGVGKSIFVDIIGKLLGRQYTRISHSDMLLNKFNAHYEKTLLASVEEAFWSGNKTRKGYLKELITANELEYEEKFLPPHTGKNYTRFIINSNEDFIVPADYDERRFMVLDVGTGWQKDRKKFGQMIRDMENGGYEGLLYFLLNNEIDPKVDLRNPPMTSCLQEQIEYNEPISIQFWRWWLEEHEGQEKIYCRYLEKDYIMYCHNHGERYPKSFQGFVMDLRKRGVEYEKKREWSSFSGKREQIWTLRNKGNL